MLKPYPPAPDRYLVGDDGSVYGVMNSHKMNCASPRPLKQWKCQHGYLHVGIRLVRGGQQRRTPVHAMVCETFNGSRPSPKHQVAHNDGVRDHNVSSNLRWVSVKENAADRSMHGRTVWGERATRGKLTEAEVRQIKDELKLSSGQYGAQVSLARKYNVSYQAIWMILRGKSWKRLDACLP